MGDVEAVASEVAFEAAERELAAARQALNNVEHGVDETPELDRYILALAERNVLRGPRP